MIFDDHKIIIWGFLYTKDTSKAQGFFKHDILKILFFQKNLLPNLEITNLESAMVNGK